MKIVDRMSVKSCLRINCSEWSLQFIEEPFKLFKLCNVFSNPKDIEKLEQELNNLTFVHKVIDIFSFSQTKDLFSMEHKNKTALAKFLQFLQFFRIFLSNKFKVDFDVKISASCSKYSCGDYLLCHDDKTEDRYVAFIYYLNPSWKVEWGGSLDIFDHDENGLPTDARYSFFPEHNTMIFFEVGNLTYHQVSEVLCDSSCRMTINGWFHSQKALKLKPLSLPYVYLPSVETHDRGTLSGFQSLVSEEFFEDKYTELIIEGFQENGAMMLQNFLKPDVFGVVSSELTSSDMLWFQRGPANMRKYYATDLNLLPSKTKSLVTYFHTKFMCSFVESVTGHKLYKQIKGDERIHLMSIEIQCWQRGCYSLLTHDDNNLKKAAVDVLLFFNVFAETSSVRENTMAGNICYYENKALAVKHEIEANNNSICLVHKRRNETSFVPYISVNSNLKFHVIRLSYQL